MENQEKLRVVCIGDSITEGMGLWDDPSAIYPAVLQEFLGPEYEVFNQGVSCTCVSNFEKDGRVCGMPYVLQDKFKQALELAGDIYVVMLGTNDAQDGMDDVLDIQDPYNMLIDLEPQFEFYYQNILDAIRNAAPKALLFLVTPIPVHHCIWRKHQEKYLSRLLPHIKSLAEENHTRFVDLHEEFMKLPPERLASLYQEDGLHPNEAGTMLIASVIAYSIGNREYE